ncbi:phosphonate C-P lyase system protein PhnH [Serratia fonticola]|uniref:phosphonate C-P lyase system protein PhnH n=1 Tax=Serratia fonticola TaxID=47917 RepID=UPI0027EC0510|nr:phosphonate C-P lyase system protein PhnH [Serratia fonticola]MDQ7210562.1 phosphonate C-P lyase system protein PhnH [Serratia fonticola]HBE9080540.1 phosphonate C-P lyase system protein PhnH [Serratia fonticola]HBE9090831.1 phosphonate C-P lyase system protein PhnH [Serratia fonticola]HBE9153686.1 phosphonate C-P lyase system protein PhnH [Serratia fonticola]
MTLLAGFDQPIEQSQSAFRLILKALSEPGVIVELPGCPTWGALNAASTAVILTLADQETPLQLCSTLNSEQVLTNIRFHTGAPLATRQEDIHLAVWDDQLRPTELSALPHGSEVSPEFGATLVVQIAALAGSHTLRLSGPGIEKQREISPPLPAALRAYLLERPQRFPLGLDIILTCGERLMALPRTTRVEEC